MHPNPTMLFELKMEGQARSMCSQAHLLNSTMTTATSNSGLISANCQNRNKFNDKVKTAR